MATPQPTELGTLDESSSRLVWVLNRDAKPYKGTFEGIKLVIPANHEKIGKKHHQGGNLMPYLAARQFITDYKEPQDWIQDRAGKLEPVFGPKALYDQELNTEEYLRYVGLNKEQIKKAAILEEKRARRKISDELKKTPNKIAMKDDEDE